MILVALLLIVSSFPIPGNYKIYIVESGSMAPTIPTGSVIAVKPDADYKIGEVITFGPMSVKKVPTTHRIQDIRVQAGEPIYITKGDANNAPDAKDTLKKDIIGKVVFHLPYAGYLIVAAKTPLGFLVFIIIPALFVLWDEVVNIWNEIKKIKAKKTQE